MRKTHAETHTTLLFSQTASQPRAKYVQKNRKKKQNVKPTTATKKKISIRE